MEDLKNISAKAESLLKQKQIEKYAITSVLSEKREFSAENGSFNLFRTLFNNNIAVNVFKGTKEGLAAGNDVTDQGIENTVNSAIGSCEAAPEDPAKDIAPDQGKEVFNQGSFEPDLDLFFSRVKELSDTIAKDYPLIKVMLLIASHDKKHSLYKNTNGTEFERFAGSYSVDVEYSAANGEAATGLDSFDFETLDLNTPFIEQAGVRAHLENCVKQLNITQIPEKFEGTVIVAPDCLGQFLYMTFGNYIGDQVILDGTSLWIDKLDKQVADSRVNITFSSTDNRIVCPACSTGDGFKTEDVKVIENGILKSFNIALYTANKTNKKVSKAGSGLIMANGGKKLEDIIKETKQGLLVGGFSGGHPQTNGEFSGVAKNSFYIENGAIKGAVKETMINGNLGKVLMDVKDISSETVCDGGHVLPYLAVNGIVVSSK